MFIGWQVVIEKLWGLLPQSVSCSYNLVLKHQTIGCLTFLFYTVCGVAELAEPRAQSEGSEQDFVFGVFCNILKNFQIAAATAPFFILSPFQLVPDEMVSHFLISDLCNMNCEGEGYTLEAGFLFHRRY